MRFFSLLIVCSILLASCVPFLNPLYTSDTVEFREDLLGSWECVDCADGSENEVWIFSKEGDENYRLEHYDGEHPSILLATLVKLEGLYFLDLETYPDEARSYLGQATQFPVHQYFSVDISDDELVVSMFNVDMDSLASIDPPISFISSGESDLITLSTEDAQAFVLGRPDFFEEEYELRLRRM